MNLHAPYVLQEQQQAQGGELICLAQNAQQLQKDKITLDNQANCLLSQVEWNWENQEVIQFYC